MFYKWTVDKKPPIQKTLGGWVAKLFNVGGYDFSGWQPKITGDIWQRGYSVLPTNSVIIYAGTELWEVEVDGNRALQPYTWERSEVRVQTFKFGRQLKWNAQDLEEYMKWLRSRLIGPHQPKPDGSETFEYVRDLHWWLTGQAYNTHYSIEKTAGIEDMIKNARSAAYAEMKAQRDWIEARIGEPLIDEPKKGDAAASNLLG